MSKRRRAAYGTSNLPAEFFEGKVDHPWRDPADEFDLDAFYKWQDARALRKAEQAAKAAKQQTVLTTGNQPAQVETGKTTDNKTAKPT